MKEINRKIYLNEVALKTRYQLLNLNQQNEKLGYEIGKNWNRNSLIPILDNDIFYNKYIHNNYSIKEINSENRKIYNNIKKSGIIKYLDKIEHTSSLSDEIMNIRGKQKRDYYFTRYQQLEKKLKKQQEIENLNLLRNYSRNNQLSEINNSNGYYNLSQSIRKESNNNKLNNICYNTLSGSFHNKLMNKSSFLNKFKINNNTNSRKKKIKLNLKNKLSNEKLKLFINKSNNNKYCQIGNLLSSGNLVKSNEKNEFFQTRRNYLEPKQMPKMTLINFNHYLKFNLDDEENLTKEKNKILNINFKRKMNRNKPNLINLEFDNNMEDNLDFSLNNLI